MPVYTISRTITKADDSSLISLDDAKNLLDIPLTDTSQDVAIQGAIDGISTGICNYCDRFFVVQTYRDQLRNPCFGYGDPLRTRQFPIVTDDTGEAKLTVTVDGVVLDPSSYDLDIDFGRVYLITSGWAGASVVVDYSAGFDPIPPDVVSAASIWLVGDWMARNRDPAIKSEAIFDVMTVVYNDQSSANTMDAGPPDQSCNLLLPYRMMFA